ncbi:MAG: hypothetical protein ABI647_04560 [Gemmatimonadota bacterium]
MSDSSLVRTKLSTSQLVAFAIAVLLGLGLYFWLAPRTPVVVMPAVVVE